MPIGSPTLPPSVSKTAATLKPWSAKTVELAIACPETARAEQRDVVLTLGAEDLADLGESTSIEYPTPRLPNFPKPERSRLICVALMFVYSLISWDEMRSSIFFACVSTCR